ncbi:putative RING-H2 finger protein ATL12 [Silene latifolia]|uniref:putative RING-H2 finger protein ATL12 n=1 Tax=Silene latifolia TaxID=37657 RepID=UPI003D7867D3
MILPMLLESRFFLVFVILISTKLANAQADKLNNTASNFQPSLFVVIGVLSFMFSLTFILLLYAKMCYREPTAIHIQNPNQNNPNRGMFGIQTRFSGLDIDVVEALPFFRFSSLKGAKQGLQCSVCLAEFEDIEILRLLPKCKHGFHIECIDQWLENHSTCPLCRQKVSIEDINKLIYSSNSMRLIVEGKSSLEEASLSNLEIFIEREDDERSSRFNIGDSFRRIFNANKKEEVIKPMELGENFNLHRLNHQIVVSDVVFKNRWSDVSSSDLMFLNSEMLGIMSSDRISSSNMLGGKNYGNHSSSTMSIKEEMERKIMLDQKFGQLKRCSSNSSLKIETGFDDSVQIKSDHSRIRAMSEITAVSRFKDLRSMKNKLRQCLKEPDNCSNDENVRDDEIKRRRKWFPIAKRTVQWFANRENYRFQHEQNQPSRSTGQILDV